MPDLTRIEVIKLAAVSTGDGLNLCGVDLYGLNLKKLNLSGTDFSNAILPDLSYNILITDWKFFKDSKTSGSIFLSCNAFFCSSITTVLKSYSFLSLTAVSSISTISLLINKKHKLLNFN